MSIVDFTIDANDNELSFGDKVLRVFPPGSTIPADAQQIAGNDHLWCWPVQATPNVAGLSVPDRIDCDTELGPAGGCQICASSGCTKGPPPPTVLASVPPPDGSGDKNVMVVARERVAVGTERVAINAPPGWDSAAPFQLGPIIVLGDGPMSAISADVLTAVWAAVAAENRPIKLHLYNVVDPAAFPLDQVPAPTNLHPLHNKVIAIPATDWTPPAPVTPPPP